VCIVVNSSQGTISIVDVYKAFTQLALIRAAFSLDQALSRRHSSWVTRFALGAQ
jgi:hypothetical protein